jgi:hypothetical protein
MKGAAMHHPATRTPGRPEAHVLRVGDTTFDVLCLRPGDLPSFDAVLDMLSERSRRDHLTVLDDNPLQYGATGNYGLPAPRC